MDIEIYMAEGQTVYIKTLKNDNVTNEILSFTSLIVFEKTRSWQTL